MAVDPYALLSSKANKIKEDPNASSVNASLETGHPFDGLGLSSRNGNNNDDGDSGGGGGGGGGGGYGSYGYGSGGSGRSGADIAKNLLPLANYNTETLQQSFQNQKDAADLADQQNKALRDLQIQQARRAAGADWFPQIKKLQAVRSNLATQIGNGAYSSTFDTVNDLTGRADDDIDVNTLTQMMENIQNYENNYSEAMMSSKNQLNQLAAQLDASQRELNADIFAQINNMSEDEAAAWLQDGKIVVPDEIENPFEYDKHRVGTYKPEDVDWFRPKEAEQTAQNTGLHEGLKKSSQSANNPYWNYRLYQRGYDRREM